MADDLWGTFLWRQVEWVGGKEPGLKEVLRGD
jgi:hypothetical protein